MSVRRFRVVYDEDVRQVVASLPPAGKQSLAELLRELTRDASSLERLGAGPAEQEEVAEAGESMPPKSTYFYPKVPTGLVFNPLT